MKGILFMFNQQFYPGYIPNYNQQVPQSSMQNSQILQGQTIQKIQKSNDIQAFCYFVNNIEDMKSLKIAPDTYYVGINAKEKEIYIRKMEEDGVAVLEKYKFEVNSSEKTELQIINERLANIEDTLSQLPKQRETLTLKGKNNGS